MVFVCLVFAYGVNITDTILGDLWHIMFAFSRILLYTGTFPQLWHGQVCVMLSALQDRVSH